MTSSDRRDASRQGPPAPAGGRPGGPWPVSGVILGALLAGTLVAGTVVASTVGLAGLEARRSRGASAPTGGGGLAADATSSQRPARRATSGQEATTGEASPADLQALETFDAAWELVRDTHFDPELNGVDWAAVRRDFRPRAARAADVEELREVIRSMLDRLGQSHFRLWPGDVVDALERARSPGEEDVGTGGDPGLEVGWIDGRVLVTRVGEAASAAGVRPGWELVAVGAHRLQEPLELLDERIAGREMALEVARLARGMLAGPPGAAVEVVLRDGDGELREVSVTRRRPQGRVMKFGNLPPIRARIDDRRLELAGGTEVGLVRFNIWLPLLAPELDRAVERLRGADGMIIDLRGNPGGVGGMVMGFAGHFLDEPVSLGTLRTRDSELRYVANPRRVDGQGRRVEPFGGPLAILVDATTGSTSEVFAGGLQALGRARVFGQRTVGAVLPSLMDRLPNGDVLQHAFADFVTAAGDRLEGRGVVPDEPVPVTREGLLEGRDAPLEAAMSWIEEGPGGDSAPGDGFDEENG